MNLVVSQASVCAVDDSEKTVNGDPHVGSPQELVVPDMARHPILVTPHVCQAIKEAVSVDDRGRYERDQYPRPAIR